MSQYEINEMRENSEEDKKRVKIIWIILFISIIIYAVVAPEQVYKILQDVYQRLLWDAL